MGRGGGGQNQVYLQVVELCIIKCIEVQLRHILSFAAFGFADTAGDDAGCGGARRCAHARQ